jgi:hypothetical protein
MAKTRARRPALDANTSSAGNRMTLLANTGALLASIASLAVTAYTLVFLIKPSLKPPEELGGSIVKLEYTRGITLGNFLNLIGAQPQLAPGEALDDEGMSVFVRVELQGSQRKDFGLVLQAVDVRTRRAVERLSSACESLSPAAPLDTSVKRCWVRSPKAKGQYLLKAELYESGPRGIESNWNPDQVPMLDFAFSKPFSVPD